MQLSLNRKDLSIIHRQMDGLRDVNNMSHRYEQNEIDR